MDLSKVRLVHLAIVTYYLAVVVKGSCPDGWSELREKCYRLYTEEKKGFNASLEACKGEGATLASTPNVEIYDVLVGMMRQSVIPDAWIGLYLSEIPDCGGYLECRRQGWIWLDGAPYSYPDLNKWETFEPTGGGHCARLNKDDGWRDISCGNQFAYFCQKELTAPPSTTSTTTEPTTATTITTTSPPSAPSTSTTAPTPGPTSTTSEPGQALSSTTPDKAPAATSGCITMDQRDQLDKAWEVHNRYDTALIVIFCLFGVLLVVVVVLLFIVYMQQGAMIEHLMMKKEA